MAPMQLAEDNLNGPAGSLWNLGSCFAQASPSERDDSSLCFLCMRWTSGDEGCRRGVRCDYQVALDRLEPRT